MKELKTIHKDIPYLFRLYEKVSEIDVFKNGLATYSMVEERSGLIRCTCPGSTYHNECWHKGIVQKLRKQSPLKTLWAKWGEEAAVMRWERENGKNF